jgi:hypothetical protein
VVILKQRGNLEGLVIDREDTAEVHLKVIGRHGLDLRDTRCS